MISMLQIPKKIILASSSPRRKDLLEQMGIAFDIVPSSIDENVEESYIPSELVCHLAAIKAEAVAAKISADSLIIGADTIVVKEYVLGKPNNRDDAIRMLSHLQDGFHNVLTGIALIDQSLGYKAVSYESTRVEMIPLSIQQIEWYVDNEELIDKAGSYSIQGLAAAFIPRIDGCYYNVVGLPIHLLWTMLVKYQQEMATVLSNTK